MQNLIRNRLNNFSERSDNSLEVQEQINFFCIKCFLRIILLLSFVASLAFVRAHVAARWALGGFVASHAAVALIDGGADINQPSGGDQTQPLLIATINGQFDLALTLLARGADPNEMSLAGTTPLFAVLRQSCARFWTVRVMPNIIHHAVGIV